jgi:hypothetical protein
MSPQSSCIRPTGTPRGHALTQPQHSSSNTHLALATPLHSTRFAFYPFKNKQTTRSIAMFDSSAGKRVAPPPPAPSHTLTYRRCCCRVPASPPHDPHLIIQPLFPSISAAATRVPRGHGPRPLQARRLPVPCKRPAHNLPAPAHFARAPATCTASAASTSPLTPPPRAQGRPLQPP